MQPPSQPQAPDLSEDEEEVDDGSQREANQHPNQQRSDLKILSAVKQGYLTTKWAGEGFRQVPLVDGFP